MKREHNKFLLILLAFAINTTGCYYDVEEELYPANSSNNNCDTITPTYTLKIQPMIANKCAVSGCHVSNGQSPNFSSYDNLLANVSRVKARAVTEKTMPPSGPLSSCDVLALQQWINEGAKNN